MEVKYFNSHSPRLHHWRANLRCKIAARLQAERNAKIAKANNWPNAIPDWGTCATVDKLELDYAIKITRATDLADHTDSPMLRAMANHRADQLTKIFKK